LLLRCYENSKFKIQDLKYSTDICFLTEEILKLYSLEKVTGLIFLFPALVPNHQFKYLMYATLFVLNFEF